MNCDLIERCVELMVKSHTGISEAVAADIGRQLYREFGGERVYIPKLNIDHERIKQEFKGDNIKDLVTMFGASESTIRRHIGSRKPD